MEIKQEPVDDPSQEVDEASADTRGEENPSSGESTMTCSTQFSLLSLTATESMSDSAPDANSSRCSVKRNRRGRRGRKPKLLPKTSLSNEDLLKVGGAMENNGSMKRIKILLPQKVSTDFRKENIANSESSCTQNHDEGEAISALPNLNFNKPNMKKRNRGKTTSKNVTKPTGIFENSPQENRSDQNELISNHQFQIVNKNSDRTLTDKVTPFKEYSGQDETALKNKISELCKDIKKTNLGNRKKEPNVCPMIYLKPIAMDARMPVSLNKITSDSSENSGLSNSVRPSSSQGDYGADSATAQNMRAKMMILVQRRREIIKNRRGGGFPKAFVTSAKKRINELTDKIDQIDAILAKEIANKEKYYKKGYKITHQVLSNLAKQNRGCN